MKRIMFLLFALVCSSLHVDIYPPVFRIAVVGNDGSEIVFGSGVLINRKTGCLVSAQHLTVFTQVPNTRLVMYHKRTPQNIMVRWEHDRQDLAVACLIAPIPTLPLAAKPSGDESGCGTHYTAEGYPIYVPPDTPYETPPLRSLPITPFMEQSPPLEFKSNERAELTKRLRALGVEKPRLSLSQSGLATAYITQHADRGRLLMGLSGGGIFDNCRRLRSIAVMHVIRHSILLSVPITEIPKHFFEHE